ncbi:hypothetical protein BKI51_05165 [Alphaproteobacteria bacterium AO1-B]|nr:hypothetical protein BKI51_05165 [Alphaproteobacteria bacterium AO1-B]
MVDMRKQIQGSHRQRIQRRAQIRAAKGAENTASLKRLHVTSSGIRVFAVPDHDGRFMSANQVWLRLKIVVPKEAVRRGVFKRSYWLRFNGERFNSIADTFAFQARHEPDFEKVRHWLAANWQRVVGELRAAGEAMQ